MTVTLSTLKTIKNTVVGNPSAKTKLSKDGSIELITALLNPSQIDVEIPAALAAQLRIEAAHVISSVAYGSSESLRPLLTADAPPVLLHALADSISSGSVFLKIAIVRAFRNVVIACAEAVGPWLWGLSIEQIELRHDAKSALDLVFQVENLDIFLPLLRDSNHQVVLAVTLLLASCLRIPAHRLVVAGWQPKSERVKTAPKRGWEKPTLSDQNNDPLRGGGWVVRQLVCLLKLKDPKLLEAALLALSAIANDDPVVAIALSKPDAECSKSILERMPYFMTARTTDLQIAACLCATRIIRASHSSPTSQDFSSDGRGNLVLTVFHVLSRIMESPSEVISARTRACHVLSFIVADDRDLQRTACDSGVLKKLSLLLESIQWVPSDEWQEEETEALARLREAAFTAIAKLAMLRNDIRREVIDPSIVHFTQSALVHPHVAVRYAACHCARALTRSVQVLRTSVIDSGIGTSLFETVKNRSEDRRVRAVALAGMCNLLNNFSPFREILLERGGIEQLIVLLDTDEESLRVDALWAIKNALYNGKMSEKESIMAEFGWERLLRYLKSPQDNIREQAVAMIRNLAFPQPGLEYLRSGLGDEAIFESVEEALESNNPDMIVQGLGTLRNLTLGQSEFRKALVQRKNMWQGLKECLQHANVDVRRAAAQSVVQLIKGTPRPHSELREHGIDITLRLMYGTHVTSHPHGHSTTNTQMGYEEDKQVRDEIKKALAALDSGRDLV